MRFLEKTLRDRKDGQGLHIIREPRNRTLQFHGKVNGKSVHLSRAIFAKHSQGFRSDNIQTSRTTRHEDGRNNGGNKNIPHRKRTTQITAYVYVCSWIKDRLDYKQQDFRENDKLVFARSKSGRNDFTHDKTKKLGGGNFILQDQQSLEIMDQRGRGGIAFLWRDRGCYIRRGNSSSDPRSTLTFTMPHDNCEISHIYIECKFRKKLFQTVWFIFIKSHTDASDTYVLYIFSRFYVFILDKYLYQCLRDLMDIIIALPSILLILGMSETELWYLLLEPSSRISKHVGSCNLFRVTYTNFHTMVPLKNRFCIQYATRLYKSIETPAGF